MCADVDGEAVDALAVRIGGRQDDARSARRGAVGQLGDQVGAGDDERGVAPRRPGGQGVGGDAGLDVGGCGEPEQVIDQLAVAGDDQNGG